MAVDLFLNKFCTIPLLHVFTLLIIYFRNFFYEKEKKKKTVKNVNHIFHKKISNSDNYSLVEV